MDPSIRLTHLNCKCCKKRLKSTSILRHLSQKTKLNCISSYTEDELKSFKEKATKRTKFKIAKWRNKNEQYYANQRKHYYYENKEKIAKKEAEHYAKNKRKLQYYHKNKDSIKKAEYYRQRGKYTKKFFHDLKSIHDSAVAQEVVSDFNERLRKTNEKFQEMLKSVKEKQPKHGWKNKSIRFLEFEVQSTILHLRYIVTETFQKYKKSNDSMFSKQYDFRLKLDVFHTLHLQIGIRLDQVTCLLKSFIKGKDTEGFIKRQYIHDKNASIEEYNEELKIIKENSVQRIQDKLHEKLRKSQIDIEKGLVPWFLKNTGTDMITFLRNQKIQPEHHEILDRLEKTVADKITEIQSEIEEVNLLVGETICKWKTNCKKWRDKEASDSMFIKDMFEILTQNLERQKEKLGHILQFNLEYVYRNIANVQPPKDLPIENFFKVRKGAHDDGDPKNCNRCSSFQL